MEASGISKNEDIVGYRIGNELVCVECYDEAEDGVVSQEKILTKTALLEHHVQRIDSMGNITFATITWCCERCGKIVYRNKWR